MIVSTKSEKCNPISQHLDSHQPVNKEVRIEKATKTHLVVSVTTTTTQPFYGPLDFVRDYPGEPVSEW